MEEKIDEVVKHYFPVERIDPILTIFFWLSAIASFILLHKNTLINKHSMAIKSYEPFFEPIFLLLVLTYTILSFFKRNFLIPAADTQRYKQLLSDSLGVPISSELTKGYYNNEFPPSITRLGACLLENSFFGKAITGEMANKQRIKMFAYFLLWVFFFACRSTPLTQLVWITQIVFSGEILFHTISIEILRIKITNVFNSLHSVFLSKPDFKSDKIIAMILDNLLAYERAKAASAIKQSTAIYNQLNSKLTEDFVRIKNQLNFVEQAKLLKN